MAGKGSAPGERRGGRKAGVPNKATAEVRAAAQKFTKDAIATLVSIMKMGESEQARIAAAKEILDRGHGKAHQAIGMAGADGTLATARRVIFELDDASANANP